MYSIKLNLWMWLSHLNAGPGALLMWVKIPTAAKDFSQKINFETLLRCSYCCCVSVQLHHTLKIPPTHPQAIHTHSMWTNHMLYDKTKLHTNKQQNQYPQTRSCQHIFTTVENSPSRQIRCAPCVVRPLDCQWPSLASVQSNHLHLQREERNEQVNAADGGRLVTSRINSGCVPHSFIC